MLRREVPDENAKVSMEQVTWGALLGKVVVYECNHGRKITGDFEKVILDI